MPTINDAVINAPSTGECEINKELVVSLFDRFSFISKWISDSKNEYTLVRMKRGKGNFKNLKIRISESDALFLIKELKLNEIESTIYRSGSGFYREDYSPT